MDGAQTWITVILNDLPWKQTEIILSFLRLGKATNSDYGVIFARIGETFPRHPAQLYEAIAYFAIFVLLLSIYLFVKRRPNGLIFGLLFTLAFIARISCSS